MTRFCSLVFLALLGVAGTVEMSASTKVIVAGK